MQDVKFVKQNLFVWREYFDFDDLLQFIVLYYRVLWLKDIKLRKVRDVVFLSKVMDL